FFLAFRVAPATSSFAPPRRNNGFRLRAAKDGRPVAILRDASLCDAPLGRGPKKRSLAGPALTRSNKRLVSADTYWRFRKAEAHSRFSRRERRFLQWNLSTLCVVTCRHVAAAGTGRPPSQAREAFNRDNQNLDEARACPLL